MFGIFKKNKSEKAKEFIENELREYMSVDNIKAHLVDMLEENKRLNEELERKRKEYREELTKEIKKSEIATVTADEYKSRVKEKEKEIMNLKGEINRQDREIERLKRDQNHWKTKAEMADVKVQKTEDKARETRQCRYWLERELKRYGNWEELTKTELIEIIRKAINKQEETEAEEQRMEVEE